MWLLYQFFIFLLASAFKIASFFNSKAKSFIHGRKNIFEELSQQLDSSKKTIWIHCASLGEFEQARPLIEKLKKEERNAFLLLTFFSPSGYEVKKNYNQVDLVCYLPIDSLQNAKRFIKMVKPQLVFMVKYEFWFNYLNELKKQEIPCFLVSGIFWKEQQFFQFYGKWFANRLNVFTHFFVQDENSKVLLKQIGYQNSTVSGDSRFDRVVEIADTPFSEPVLSEFVSNNLCLIVGSAWDKEIEFSLAISKKFPDLKLIIAPHNIEQGQLDYIRSHFNSTFFWSEKNQATDISKKQTLVIDSIGILSKIYRYGHIAFIGGGFGSGVHNTVEAAVYGLPVLFGPNYKRFKEINDLIDIGGGFPVKDYQSFEKAITKLVEQPEFRKEVSSKNEAYVANHSGATTAILNYLKSKQLLS